MQYVALFHKEKKGYGVTFPDFPECTTFGEDLDEAVDQAHEALALYLEYFLENGGTLPDPTPKKSLLALPENNESKAINIAVQGDGSDFEEFEVTMHAHLLSRIEKYCTLYGVSPADFFAVASREAIRNDVFSE
ncbi:HicB family protein [Pseudodesulfovibrio cashew]|uniref:HicB family protein n=1 Tax=Pseudodesulfovibrio cashew TaxID=2678688 RepID=A0A6I6JKS6_9BACT|nr:type II toxin-antitoxin system HicB family antitoxin [Pseudodesulfovibrio cashew]QGY40902.1 HicB family protein [Pseudodesulfovibrio cashew]